MKSPQTLQEAIQFFSDYENCRQFMISVRWIGRIGREIEQIKWERRGSPITPSSTISSLFG